MSQSNVWSGITSNPIVSLGCFTIWRTDEIKKLVFFNKIKILFLFLSIKPRSVFKSSNKCYLDQRRQGETTKTIRPNNISLFYLSKGASGFTSNLYLMPKQELLLIYLSTEYFIHNRNNSYNWLMNGLHSIWRVLTCPNKESCSMEVSTEEEVPNTVPYLSSENIVQNVYSIFFYFFN